MNIFKRLFKAAGTNQKAELQTKQAQSTTSPRFRFYFSCPICGCWYDTESDEEDAEVYRGCMRCGYSGTGPANIEEINIRIAEFDLRVYDTRREIMNIIHQCANEEEFNQKISDIIKEYDDKITETKQQNPEINKVTQWMIDFDEKRKKETYEAITDLKGNCSTYKEMKEKVEIIKKQEDEELITRWEKEKNQARFNKKDLKRKGIETI